MGLSPLQTVTVAGGLLATATWAAMAPPIPVSPGSFREAGAIAQRCPTFSWGAVESARAYELVVLRLPAKELWPGRGQLSGTDPGLDQAEPALQQRLPAGASSWTPSMARCLAPGGRYAWLVRSLGEVAPGNWSEPRLFQVTTGPSTAQVEQALAVLEAFLGSGETTLARVSAQDSPGASAAAPLRSRRDRRDKPEAAGQRARGSDRRSSRSHSRGGAEGGQVPEGGVPPPDAVAVRGEAPDPTGVTFGLHGISASSDNGSAGVVGQSTATSGATTGVLGEVESPDGVAGAFDNRAGGQILSGRNNAVEVFGVDGVGTVTAGAFVGNGSGLTSVDADTLEAQPGSFYRDWSSLINVPPGFADGIDNDSGGDIMAVIAGAGLTGGGDFGDVTVAADFSQTQARVVASCLSGEAIVAINADGTVECGTVEPSTAITIVDVPGNSQDFYTSVALGADGFPVISYYDATAGALKVAKCNDVFCAGGNETVTTVDNSADLVGEYTSIVLGSDQLPVISYQDTTVSSLKVAKCNDPACAGGDETLSTVDDSANVLGAYNSIALGADGLPVISYYDLSAAALKVAKCNDPACTGGDETVTTVDDPPANSVGWWTSIAVPADGLPVISYFDATAGDLKIAKCNDPACAGGDETITTIDGAATHSGWYTSITLGTDGLPVISYYDNTPKALKVAKCNDPACAGGDETITIVDDPAGVVGEYTSIALGADGLPVISYRDFSAGALKVAKCNDPACAGGDESLTIVDNPATIVDGYTSIALGADGLPVMSYWDRTAGALKVAKCANPSCW